MKASAPSVTRKLKIARGQVDAVLRMIEEQRYCLDIHTQLSAAIALLDRARREVMQGHVRSCVREALEAGEAKEARHKIEEALACLEKMNG